MLVLWLETDPAIAQQIALHTLSLCNNLPEGEIVEIGIDPRTYDPAAAPTLGEFLKRIAGDFANLLVEHQSSSIRPLTLVIEYVSGSLDRGVLTELTHGEPGLLNSHALLRCTPDSMIGRWWGSRRGYLTQTIAP